MNIQQKFKSYVLSLIALITFAAPLAIPVAAHAAGGTSGGCSNNITSGISSGATDAAGGSAVNCNSTTVGNNSVSTLASKVVNIFSIIVGAVAIIMLIYGGFRYITSGGESGRVSGAKNTIVYAIIGLIIVALAQLIVHFVLSQSNSVTQ
ncbi:MAG TPA: pilin [Candidatus Saccharimonadales bacterium]|nr:pilin [Candidatus Saccharimonadales bacterium]